jgi:hypothetical protein
VLFVTDYKKVVSFCSEKEHAGSVFIYTQTVSALIRVLLVSSEMLADVEIAFCFAL